MNNKITHTNNTNHHPNGSQSIAQSPTTSNGLNGPNGIHPLLRQNQVPMAAIIVSETELPIKKRKASEELVGQPRAKAFVTSVSPSNGLQQRNLTQSKPNVVSTNTGLFAEHSMNYGPTNPVNNNTNVQNFSNDPNAQLGLSELQQQQLMHQQLGPSEMKQHQLLQLRQWQLDYAPTNPADHNPNFKNNNNPNAQNFGNNPQVNGFSNGALTQSPSNAQHSRGIQTNQPFHAPTKNSYGTLTLPQELKPLSSFSCQQSQLQCQLIQKCIDLSAEYFREGNYALCRQEIEKGLKLPGGGDFQKISLYIYLSAACNGLKDYLGGKEAAQAGLKLPGCTNAQKIDLYIHLSFACYQLSDYAGGKEAAKAGLKLPGASDSQKVSLNIYLSAAAKAFYPVFYYVGLSVNCNQLEDYAGAKEAAQAGLKLPALNDQQRGSSYLNLYSLYLNLYIACKQLKDDAGAQEAAQGLLKLTGATDAKKIMLCTNLSLTCYRLKDHALALQAAETALIFSECSGTTKALMLGIRLKCNKDINQDEELQNILSMSHALKDIDNDIAKKEAMNSLSEVISAEEILTRLSEIFKSKSDPESRKAIWKAIEVLAALCVAMSLVINQ